jgi:predicted MFS family arabinose efflux permease
MITTNSLRGRVALMAGHCAGMVDLVALPVWVGTLISVYRFDPQQAGMLATLFLAGAMMASLVLAPRLNRLNARLTVTLGYAGAALAFGLASTLADFGSLAALHALAGVSAGAALSVTHGTIARSAQPHRLFAIVGLSLGIFAIVFMGATPPLVARLGGPALFQVFAAVMVVGALAAALAFPVPDVHPVATVQGNAARGAEPLPRAVWWGVLGVACMGLVQAMAYSFLERVGSDRGFGLQAVTAVLIASGFINLIPPALAAVLEKRLPARLVLGVGPALQAALVVLAMNAPAFGPYAVAASMFVAVMIFTHTFAFGALARLDPSGRALAATPAMLMVGAAMGPILGGTLVKSFGYGAIGIAALVMDAIAIYAFTRIPKQAATVRPLAGVSA